MIISFIGITLKMSGVKFYKTRKDKENLKINKI